MSIVFFFFYLLIIITIVTNVLKVVKAFKGQSQMMDNVNDMINDRFKSAMGNSIFKNNNDKNIDVDLDTFMKSNINPIKETKGKRRKI